MTPVCFSRDMNDTATGFTRVTRDEIMDGQQARYYGYVVTQRKPGSHGHQGVEAEFKVLSVDPDTKTGYAVSLLTKQLVRFADAGRLAHNGMLTVTIQHALDTGDEAGTLEFGGTLATRGTVNSRLFVV